MQHNERGAEMMGWLPWYYKDSRIMNEIILAQSREVAAVREGILYILAQFYVDTADELGLEFWEKELGLTPAEGASKKLRKAQIKAKLQRPAMMTPKQIQNIVNLFTKNKRAVVSEIPGKYRFRVDIPLGDLLFSKELRQAIEEAKPAHLGYDVFLHRILEIEEGISYFIGIIDATIGRKHINLPVVPDAKAKIYSGVAYLIAGRQVVKLPIPPHSRTQAHAGQIFLKTGKITIGGIR